MNSIWNYKRIGDVCTVERGGSPRPIDKYITEDENGINWIKIGDTSDSMYITSAAQKIIPDGMKKSRYVQPGDFLLSNSMSFGRPYILKIDGCIHDGWLVLRDNNNLFDKRFLYYYLSSPTTYQKFKSLAVGGVVNNLNSNMVRDVEIPIPSIEEQSNIADVLDKIKVIIDNRKQQLQQLDDLVKARFVEMFGDPKYNKNNLVKIAEIGTLTSGGTPSRAKPEYFEGDIRWYSAGELNSLYLPDSVEHISETALKQSSAKLFNKGTLMLGMYDTAAFKMGILTEDSSSNQACANLKPKQGYNIVWLYYLFDIMKPIFLQERQGVRQKNLSLSKIKEFEVPFVSFELQNEFANFVEQVDKSKVAVQKALDEAQTLFDSLMQEYFG